MYVMCKRCRTITYSGDGSCADCDAHGSSVMRLGPTLEDAREALRVDVDSRRSMNQVGDQIRRREQRCPKCGKAARLRHKEYAVGQRGQMMSAHAVKLPEPGVGVRTVPTCGH